MSSDLGVTVISQRMPVLVTKEPLVGLVRFPVAVLDPVHVLARVFAPGPCPRHVEDCMVTVIERDFGDDRAIIVAPPPYDRVELPYQPLL